jgi:hypothetical protein
MKNFVVTYESPRNLFKGKKLIQAESISDAQTIFFEWVKEQSTYQHMWSLNFDFEVIQ